MKWIIAIEALFSISAHAQDSYSQCINDATVMSLAAQFRDAGNTPEQAYTTLKTRFQLFTKNLPDEILKGFVNTAFFDPDASKMSSDELKAHDSSLCVAQARRESPKPYAPLN